MKKLLFIPILLCLILAFSIKTAPEGKSLKGTWIMVSEKHGDAAIMEPEKGTVKRKYLTDTHFSWVEYNDKGDVIRLAGGSYTLQNNQYKEVIEYVYPKGSDLLGASIPFTCKLNGNKWTHIGMIQYQDIDEETGQYAVTSSDRLEEVWERVD